MNPFVVVIPNCENPFQDGTETPLVGKSRDFNGLALTTTDWYADELFGSVSPEDTLTSPVGTTVVDVEALNGNWKWGGQTERHSMHRQLTKVMDSRTKQKLQEQQAVKDVFWVPFHEKLESMIDQRLVRFGKVTVFICVSMTDIPSADRRQSRTQLPDVCIGFNEIHAETQFQLWALKVSGSHLYDVEINRPFDGTWLPEKYFLRDKRVRCLRVALRQDLYMDCTTGSKLNPRFQNHADTLGTIFNEIVEGRFVRQSMPPSGDDF